MTHTGFFERYFITPFIRKYSDFKGEESRQTAFLSLGAWLTVSAGVIGVLLGFIGLLGPEVGFVCLWVIGGIWLAGSLCPMAALISRASKGAADNGALKTHFLGIDKMLSAICILFLVLGILMTITTLNSGEINPYHKGRGDARHNPLLEQDEVVEEPIFTYQDATPAPIEDVIDDDSEIADTISVDDSFDPVIESITTASIPDTLSINEE